MGIRVPCWALAQAASQSQFHMGPSEKLPENCKDLPHPAEDWPRGGRAATRSETCQRPSRGAEGDRTVDTTAEGWLTGTAQRPGAGRADGRGPPGPTGAAWLAGDK